ncbi:MAG: hypothetical protein Q8Q08_08255 [Candidatus Omnitrophota bacterium]|nr:hypothetical protein [Candidatus Omnitrophota bacterium]MDZ4242102.1 hypothetical protein [Candidatus Omnitrophota bacterium]
MGKTPLGAVCYLLPAVLALGGCTVKAVGDPNRPITINAHVIVDIRGLEKTASSIEDYVSGEKPTLDQNSSKNGEAKE